MPIISDDATSAEQFEASVRQVARRLYSGARPSGSVILDGRERDELIDTGTELIIIEATKLRKMAKTESDLIKSRDLVRSLKNNSKFEDYNFRILLVTFYEPSADQSAVVENSKTGCPKEIISFSTLFSRLFDARHYLRLRDDHTFGSIRNPANENDFNVPIETYIPTALVEEGSGLILQSSEVSDKIDRNFNIVIFGDYGSGKSMTLRDMYYREKIKFINGVSIKCPVYLNLREHIAQSQPDEVLFRHADKIGFAGQHTLISAWRAGYLTIFLDGFDELTPPQFGVSIASLKHARRFAVELVKRFVEQTPKGAAIIIAGRENYFDTKIEAKSALGITEKDNVLQLAGFDEIQIAKYLKRKKNKLPNWLPTRPLLLGYLANSNLIGEGEDFISLSPTAGWNSILDKVCNREVNQIWGAGFEGHDLRRFIEGLATRSRSHVSTGHGLQDSDTRAVFQTVFGRDADAPASLLTSRLPGLGAVPGRIGARDFIDSDFADAAASGDLARFIDHPYSDVRALTAVRKSLGNLGLSMVSEIVNDIDPKLNIALVQAAKKQSLSITASDIINILNDRQLSFLTEDIVISKANFDRLYLDGDINFGRIKFDQCLISKIELGRTNLSQEEKNFPRFNDCVIDEIDGAQSKDDMPKNVLQGSTTVEIYAAFAATNNAIFESSLSLPVKVLVTMLRKLFMQRGSGRQYGALRRGLPSNSAKFVQQIAALIISHKFAEDVKMDNKTILVPNRGKSSEALSIINAPSTSSLSLLEDVRKIGV